MSAYTDAIEGESANVQTSGPVVVIDREKAGDGFWTAVKWLGAALVLVTAYREVKAFRSTLEGKLYGTEEPTAEEE